MVFGDLTKNEIGGVEFIVDGGLFKSDSYNGADDKGLWVILSIPNREVRSLYRQIIEQWLSNGHGVEWFNQFLIIC